jgi:hypothetical protein
MADTNTLINATMIAREGLRLLKNNLILGSQVYRGYEEEFPGKPKKGGTVQIRKPVRFIVTKSRVRTSSVITEQYITLNVTTQAHVSWAFSSNELTMKLEEYSERYIRPAAAKLANTVDADIADLYSDVWNTVWESSGFVTPHTFMVLAKAMQRLDEEGVPPEERCVVFNPAGHWAMANALTALYQPSVAEKAIRKGYVGTIAGADVYMDQNIKAHTVGTFHDTGSTGSDVILLASTDATLISGIVVGDSRNQKVNLYLFRTTADISHLLRVGDWFEFANVYAVNPMSGESTGVRRQFVVAADVSGNSGTGVGTDSGVIVYIQPDMINTGPYKTIDTVPAGKAVAYFYETHNKQYPMNLAFHKNAFALVFVPLEKPDGVSFAETIEDEGYSIRVVKDYDIDNDLEVIRMDILYGVKTIYPELAVRIAGAEA